MNLNDIVNDLKPIFLEVLEIDDVTLKPETTANDIEEWDSLNHIQLIIAIEKHFKIRFTADEIQHFSNVGSMCEKIIEKVK